MKIKLKICSGCGLPKPIWKAVKREKFCKKCYGKSGTGVARSPKPTSKPIPARSSKQARKDRLYTEARRQFLLDHPMCHAKIDARCLQRADSVHHKSGRVEELYLDQRFWLPICSPCHEWVERNPEKAKALGLSLSRLSDEDKNQTLT